MRCLWEASTWRSNLIRLSFECMVSLCTSGDFFPGYNPTALQVFTQAISRVSATEVIFHAFFRYAESSSKLNFGYI
jgi:hypothetical protein